MADDDEPVPRADFERALRHLNLADLDVRDLVLRLAAQVVALTDELSKRLPPTGDEPSVQAAVESAVAAALTEIQASDDGGSRVALNTGGDKYEAAAAVDVPCAELIPLCHGRCCSFRFALSTQDLDEGIIRFDHGKPYMIRQRESDGHCVHSDPVTHFCQEHAARPLPCRTYDCRNDRRIWTDFEKRIPAPPDAWRLGKDAAKLDRYERARQRGLAVWRERTAVDSAYPDDVPRKKP